MAFELGKMLQAACAPPSPLTCALQQQQQQQAAEPVRGHMDHEQMASMAGRAATLDTSSSAFVLWKGVWGAGQQLLDAPTHHLLATPHSLAVCDGHGRVRLVPISFTGPYVD